MQMNFPIPESALYNDEVIKNAQIGKLNLLRDKKRPQCQLIACAGN